MTLTELCQLAHENAMTHGFWDRPRDFGRLIALCHSELSEALEVDRVWGEGSPVHTTLAPNAPKECRGRLAPWWDGVSEELADVVIRVGDICGAYAIDLDAAVQTKMAVNAGRPHLHGKAY